MAGFGCPPRITNNERIADELKELGFVCVPLVPTEDMLHAAYYDALDEDARGVWTTMIGVSEGPPVTTVENPK
jgi:hypothetical protein